MDEIVFTLGSAIKYHNSGQVETSCGLILKAPTNRVGRQCNNLKQGFMRALKGLASNTGEVNSNKESGESEIGAGEIIDILQMSDVDYSDYLELLNL